MIDQAYKYFAFISYNAKDTDWGRRLQRKLEHYRMPATLCSERGWERTPIKPVFFAPTDIQPGGLTEELQERLRASRHLIVVCSPHSAKSEWVGREIAFFHQLGRTKRIHFFIVDGTPHSGDPETECFNAVVGQLGMPEILGANIHERVYSLPWLNRERAYVQLVSKLLGVEFDTIWQRHRRLLVQKTVAWTLGLCAVATALTVVWRANQPFDAQLRLEEANIHNPHLPPLGNAVVTLTLDNEQKTDTIGSIGQQATFTNIPHRFLERRVRIRIEARDHQTVDTTLPLKRHVTVSVSRRPEVYGHVRFRLYDLAQEKGLPRERVVVAGREAVTDAEGRVSLFIPLEEQRPAYPVKSRWPLDRDSIYMPSGDDDAVCVVSAR